jgi:hypothetical protein
MLCSNTTLHKRHLLKSCLQKKIRKAQEESWSNQLSKQRRTLKALSKQGA